jgi:thiamine-phosphate pyrophosphorylase
MQAAIKGLYAITPDRADTGELLAAVRLALEGGARLVQYRNKGADVALQHEQACELLPLCRGFGAPLVINDDLRLASLVGADGVHLGAGDGSVTEARIVLGSDKIVGVSCYNSLPLALEAESRGADYVAFGSFFPSPTKPAAVVAPVSLLSEAKRRVAIPVVAIGGITPTNAGELLAAGADAVAVISALFDSADVRATAREFSRLFEKFDSTTAAGVAASDK